MIEFERRDGVPVGAKRAGGRRTASDGSRNDTVGDVCAGRVYISRAKATREDKERFHLFHRAIDNIDYSVKRTPREHSLYPEMLTMIAAAHSGRREYEQAEQYLRESMRLHPRYAGAYAALGLLYRDLGRKEEGRDVLKEGDAATNGESAEIHYFLGLMLLEEGEIDAAVAHAREAYARRYPLPGLRQKLEQIGRWREP